MRQCVAGPPYGQGYGTRVNERLGKVQRSSDQFRLFRIQLQIRALNRTVPLDRKKALNETSLEKLSLNEATPNSDVVMCRYL